MDRLGLFPIMTKIESDRLTIAGFDLADLAHKFGTPLYLYDRATMDHARTAYRAALENYYPGRTSITYASKAFLCKALVEWALQSDLVLDCTGEIEIAIAVAGGASRDRILVHGVNKSIADLHAARRHAGTLVIDNLTELDRIVVSAERIGADQAIPDLWLRFNPDVVVKTHHVHTQTGASSAKFGMLWTEILQATEICKSTSLPLKGLHFHLGSNFQDPSPLISAIESSFQLAGKIGFTGDWHFSPGGGLGVPYHEDQLPGPDIDAFVRLIAKAVVDSCTKNDLPLPVLHLEPGRSLVARAGVALYRIGAVKPREDFNWLLVDGGLADNPRYALYQEKYSCLPVQGLARDFNQQVSIGGPYCESGDVLAEGLAMPQMKEGEFIAIPVSGAYQLSLSSNYNGASRPAVVWLEGGSDRLIVQREIPGDLMVRDLGLKE